MRSARSTQDGDETLLTSKASRLLSFCAIVKDEDSYLVEWVSFHIALGVQHFLLIDNSSSRTICDTLAPFISQGVVEVVEFPNRIKPQREAYNRALRTLANRTRWVGFFDVDEFVFPVDDSDLTSVLADYADFAGLAVNWVAFGSSGHTTKPHGWVIENFTERGALDHVVELPAYAIRGSSGTIVDYHQMNTHVKCFVDPSRTDFFRTAHHFKYAEGQFAVTENFEPIYGPFSKSVSIKRIRVNHYWSKSLEELSDKLKKGRVSQSTRTASSGYPLEQALLREQASRGVEDKEILRFLERARSVEKDFCSRPVTKPVPKARRLRYTPRDWLYSKIREWRGVVRRAKRRGPSRWSRPVTETFQPGA